jgi:hypothetical protein
MVIVLAKQGAEVHLHPVNSSSVVNRALSACKFASFFLYNVWNTNQTVCPQTNSLAVIRPSKNRSKTPWPQSASELYRPSNRHLSAKLMPTFADRGCCMVSRAVPYGGILGFPDRSRYFFFQVAPQLYSRG